MTAQRSPRARRNLTLDRIMERANVIVRAEGETALSMRRLADDCGVTPMALYHHVSDKDELLERVLDDVAGEILLPILEGTPRERLLGFLDEAYRVMIANPGVGRLWATKGITVPNMALITERLFELLADCGVSGGNAAEVLDALVIYLLGGIGYNLSRPPGVRYELVTAVDAEEAPLLHDLITSYAERDPDSQFRWGLERLWDGIEASLDF